MTYSVAKNLYIRNFLSISSMYLSRAEINPIELYNSILQCLQIHHPYFVQVPENLQLWCFHNYLQSSQIHLLWTYFRCHQFCFRLSLKNDLEYCLQKRQFHR